MDFLISSAYAQDVAPAAGPSSIMSFLPLILLVVVFYFLLIRPQQKQAKEHRNLVAALKKGDEVIIGGGVLGKISSVNDNFIMVEVAKGVELTVQRSSVATVLPKGTIKGSA